MSLSILGTAIKALLIIELLRLNSVLAWKRCNFTHKTGIVSIPYEDNDFTCKKCSNNRKVLFLKSVSNPCNTNCNGLRCDEDNSCINPDEISMKIQKPAVSKKMCQKGMRMLCGVMNI